MFVTIKNKIKSYRQPIGKKRLIYFLYLINILRIIILMLSVRMTGLKDRGLDWTHGTTRTEEIGKILNFLAIHL